MWRQVQGEWIEKLAARASQLAEKIIYFVIPSEARNLSLV
jgi:hypothetical protein